MSSSSLITLRSQLKKLQSSLKTNPTELFSSFSTFSSADSPSKPYPIELKSRRSLRGHYGKILSVCWSSDSAYLLSAAQDGKLLLWNALTGNKINAILLRSNWVMNASFSPSSKYIACGGLDNCVTVFKNIKNGTESDKNTKKEGNSSLSKGENIGNIRNNFEKASKPLMELHKHSGYISCTNFLDDNYLISASGDSTLILWDLEKKAAETVYKSHTGDVMSVVPINFNYTNLEEKSSVKLDSNSNLDSNLDKNGKTLNSIENQNNQNNKNNQKDDLNLSSLQAASEKIMDSKNISKNNISKNLNSNNNNSKNNSNNNSKNNSKNNNNNKDDEKDDEDNLISHKKINTSRLFASGSCDTTVKIHDTREKAYVMNFSYHSADVNSVHYNPRLDNLIYSGSDDGTVSCWDLRSCSVIAVYDTRNEQGEQDYGIVDVTTSKSGKIVVGATDDKHCVVWDGETGEAVNSLSGHEGKVSSVKVSPNGEAMATGSWDRTIKIWS